MSSLFRMILLMITLPVMANEQWINAASPNPLNNNEFGRALAVMDDWMIIGDPANDDMAQNGGAVFVYEKSQGFWQLFDTLEGNKLGAKIGNYIIMNYLNPL